MNNIPVVYLTASLNFHTDMPGPDLAAYLDSSIRDMRIAVVKHTWLMCDMFKYIESLEYKSRKARMARFFL